MVVDDDQDVLFLIKTALELEGMDVTTATSGYECLSLLDSMKPDALILDIMMPKMDGWETFHQIKEKYEELPIAIFTAKDQEFDKMMGIEVLGADDFIPKSSDIDSIISRVKSLLGIDE
ncbi:two-component system response regulator VicR [Methanohalophilus levihalophilus]|uniref:response regulator transcription factor n=1 Tax=Methanohalophilus levihalophilus TaxID=1431282 RepID=UPI001FDAB735|nr:response regulator [Methanohalophilus levihalophilus]MBP2029214.1 two-component system response regulator VicR [Methanohalophilus levihalophilus]